jgi:hypothetical protein
MAKNSTTSTKLNATKEPDSSIRHPIIVKFFVKIITGNQKVNFGKSPGMLPLNTW